MNKKAGSLILGLIVSGTLIGGLAVSAKDIADNNKEEYRLSLVNPMVSDKVDLDIAKGEPARAKMGEISGSVL